jgi:hypothetical protein
MSQADQRANKICLFIFGVAFFALGVLLQQCTKQPIPETLFPNVTNTIQIQK